MYSCCRTTVQVTLQSVCGKGREIAIYFKSTRYSAASLMQFKMRIRNTLVDRPCQKNSYNRENPYNLIYNYLFSPPDFSPTCSSKPPRAMFSLVRLFQNNSLLFSFFLSSILSFSLSLPSHRDTRIHIQFCVGLQWHTYTGTRAHTHKCKYTNTHTPGASKSITITQSLFKFSIVGEMSPPSAHTIPLTAFRASNYCIWKTTAPLDKTWLRACLPATCQHPNRIYPGTNW